MRALVIGATGATGKELVKQLLADSHFTEVVAFVRRRYFDKQPKLIECIVDFENLAVSADHIYGDVAFSCLGTTLKDAGSKEAQWHVDHDYQLEFAKWCHTKEVSHFLLLSAVGVDPNSNFFYNRMKGVLEMEVRSLQFKQLTIVQPGLILRPNSDRIGEVVAGKILLFINKLGLLKQYAPTSTAKLASIFVREAKVKGSGEHVITTKNYQF